MYVFLIKFSITFLNKTRVLFDGDFMTQTGSITFNCPQCGKTKITRTTHDRKIATPYKCEACGFEGPN